MNRITATYSPDDNKLRLAAALRLDDETYRRVTAAGFSWAPHLKQFIAPAWTPEREDLALELAGEIADEDSTLMDRAEDRAERFEEYRDRRLAEAETAKAAVSKIADHIPLGQPILVGHHSESHARRDAERIHNRMRKAVDLWNTSKYWQERATAAIRHARYKEQPDVRHRRIKKLQADKRKQEKERSIALLWLDLWNSIDNPNSIKRKGEQITLEERARFVANRCHLIVATGEQGQRWSAWDVLRPDEERFAMCPSMTVQQVQEVARRAYPALVAICDRWIAHLGNRLAYERAMLEEQGGYQEPPKPKSKAELPILNYSGSISYRNPYNAGEPVTGDAVGLTKAQWAAIPSDYKGTRVSICGTHRVRTTIMAPGHRHRLVAVYLTDSKQHPRPSEELKAAKKAEEDAILNRAMEESRLRFEQCAAPPEPPIADDPSAESFKALAQQAEAGVQVVSAAQLFPTPPHLASRMVELAGIESNHRVLEPSAGSGNLLTAIGPAPEKVAVEINPQLAELLARSAGSGLRIHRGDFLECNGELGTFDRIVMNPPFANAADIKHIEHAARMLRPGGVLVALCANGPRQRQELMGRAEHWEDLPPGSFKEAGTNVNVALLLIRA